MGGMSWLSGCLFAGAALALGRALQVNNGFMHPDALRWLAGATVLALAATFAARTSGGGESACRLALPWILLAGVFVQLAQLLATPPLLYAPIRQGADSPFVLTSAILLGGLAAAIAFGRRGVRIAAFSTFVACHAALGLWALRTVPDPHIDVVTVQRRAIARLAVPRTPYTFTFRNIYGDTRFYGEGMASGDRVRFGLPYPPLTLAFTAPAQWVFGDFRIGHVLALAAAAVLIASMGWSVHAMLAAAVLLTTPRVLFQLEQGWTEPSGVLLLALTGALLWRRSPRAPVALGLMLAVKQYLAVGALFVPLLPLPAGGKRMRALGVAVATAAAVTVPFFLWDPTGFMRSVVLLQLREPFRMDSLSLLAWMAGQGMPTPGVVATLAAGATGVGLALWRLPRTAGGFAAGMAIATLLLFLFGKKAFCNYYFFVLGAMAVAVAASGEARSMAAEDAAHRAAPG